ncbi:ferritin-like domain-containing protein, partial [Streptomyces sp. NPDC056405]|uniref:Dps family protein n=1 Tax=Streptomyces sp. NPDC056405 TaxID=3345811 RepID=UPI0035E03A0E
ASPDWLDWYNYHRPHTGIGGHTPAGRVTNLSEQHIQRLAQTVAERISTLGGEPNGAPGALVNERTRNDYSIGRAESIEHLGALDLVYTAVIEDHREAMQATETSDPVTQDMLIEQLRGLERFQWFVRAHLESSGGRLSTRGATTETAAADQAADQAHDQP